MGPPQVTLQSIILHPSLSVRHPLISLFSCL